MRSTGRVPEAAIAASRIGTVRQVLLSQQPGRAARRRTDQVHAATRVGHGAPAGVRVKVAVTAGVRVRVSVAVRVTEGFAVDVTVGVTVRV